MILILLLTIKNHHKVLTTLDLTPMTPINLVWGTNFLVKF